MFFCISIYAQEDIDSLKIINLMNPPNLLSTKFDKQLNTYFLNSALYLNTDVGKLNLNLGENYKSTFIRSTEKSIRDEQQFSATGTYNLFPFLKFGANLSSSILSDNRKIEINQASISNVSLFTQIIPEEHLMLAPYFGYSNNRQIGEKDYGYVYGTEGVLNNQDFSNFNLFSEIKFRNEDISPRKNTIRLFDVSGTNVFNENVTNNVRARYYQNRKDFYYAADSITARDFNIVNNIQSRIETGYSIQDRLSHSNFLNLFTLDFNGNIAWRSIDRDTRYRRIINSPSVFDTRIDELRIEFESTAGYNTSNFNGNIRFQYSERDEKHITKNFEGVNNIFFEERSQLESNKNNNSVRTSLSFQGNWLLSNSDIISFSFLQNKLRYDTPSPENYDDRDELLSIIRLRYTKKLNTFFQVFLNVEGTINHTVYLFSQKSSNNNINRIISLTSGGLYSGKNVTSLNTFEVTANYTVYDFEDLNPNFKSFSFRQYTATDSTSINFTKSLLFSHSGYIKLSEQGDFNWADFKTKPNRYLAEIYSEPKIGTKYLGALFLAGIRLFSLNTYKYDGEAKNLDSRYISIGPLTEIYYYINNRLSLSLKGWYEFITINDTTKKETANLTMNVNWNL